MADGVQPHDLDAEAPANWARISHELMSQARVLRNEYVACSELLRITLGLLHTAGRDRDRARENSAARAEENRRLRAENAMLRADITRLQQHVPPQSDAATNHTGVH